MAFLLLAWVVDAAASEPGLNSLDELRSAIVQHVSQPRFEAAQWGIKIVSLDSGTTLFETNASKLLKPASNAKLYTGALALDRLGPEYRIRTSLYAARRPRRNGTLRGDLIVYGRGDPSFAARFNGGDYSKSLQPLVDAIAAAGIKRITGSLVGDESFFSGAPFGSGWSWDDLQYYYGAEVSALTVEDNVLDLVFKSGVRVGEPCQFEVKPRSNYLSFVNRTITSATGSDRRIEIYRPVGENTAHISGTLPAGSSNVTDSVAVYKPAGLFLSLLRDALAHRAIKVSGRVHVLDPAEARAHPSTNLLELASVESRPLGEIVERMMKPSQNLYAQLLLLQVGAVSSGTNSESAGVALTTEDLGLREMRKFLDEAGIAKGDVLLEEGSGLSRGCLLTPRATVQLLTFMSNHRHADVFHRALPIAGSDGTLRARMKNTAAAGNVRAKTGSLRYVNTLSGHVTTAAGEKLVFSIMLNAYNAPANRSGRDEIDSLAVMLANFKGRSAKE